MSKLYTFSPKERELMDILWEADEPLGRQEILARAEKKPVTWKLDSFHVILNALLKKQAVEVSGFYLNSRKVGRNFKAAITKEQYSIMQVRKALEEGAGLLGDKPDWMIRCGQELPEK